MKKLSSCVSRFMLLLCLGASVCGCATTKAHLPPEEPPMHSIEEFTDDENMLFVDDPWIGFNKNIYKFNYYADEKVILPVTRGYEFITPGFMQTGVSNFFNNIGEVKTLYNSLLQGKGGKSLNALGRFLTNSTVGIGGLFEVAKSMGMERKPEDFGQTLGVWGVGSGPYLVVPILGPNTVRSTTGFVADTGTRMAMVNAIDPLENAPEVETGLTALEFVDSRHQVKFRYHKSHYPFEYFMIRYLLMQQQEFQVMK